MTQQDKNIPATLRTTGCQFSSVRWMPDRYDRGLDAPLRRTEAKYCSTWNRTPAVRAAQHPLANGSSVVHGILERLCNLRIVHFR